MEAIRDFQKTESPSGNIFYSGQFDLVVSFNPLYNCQISSIAGMSAFVRECGTDDNEEEWDFKEVLKHIQRHCSSKTEYLVDIYKDDLSYLEQYIPKDMFIFKQEYVNLTGSEMVMCLFKTEVIKTW